jgi:hypothetical protein
VAAPNPNPVAVKVLLAGEVDSVRMRIYSQAMVCVAEAESGAELCGWAEVRLPEEFLATAPGGIYYASLVGIRDGIPGLKPVLVTFLILR